MTRTVLLFAIALGAASAANAQEPPRPDARWQPWLGCWELVTESARADGLDPSAPMRRQPALAGTRVCVAPGATAEAVTLTTFVEQTEVTATTIVADAAARPVTDTGCTGTERTTWSENGRRLFTTADVTCDDRAPRKVHGLSLLTPDRLWVDIQVIDVGGRKHVRVRRYDRVDDPRAHAAATPLRAWREAAVPADAGFTLADVVESSRVLVPEAVQAALVEFDASFDLTAKRLVELDDAGVAGRVIDTLVALSYPERFVVERPRSAGPSGGYSAMGLWPYLSDRLFWSSYYSPFGYSYWNYYDPYGYSGAGFVVVQPVDPGEQPSGRGRVVKDFGYTQVRARPADPVFIPLGQGGQSGTASTSGASSSGGSSGVSGQGYSGGGGGSTGRTAQPRPPGGR